MNLLNEAKVTRVQNAAAVGTTTLTTSAVDMANFEEVTFMVMFGTITDGTPGIKVRQGNQSNMSDAQDLAGSLVSLAATDDNKVALVTVVKPVDRYVDCQIIRGGATGAVVDGGVAIQRYPRKQPVTQDTTVGGSETHSSPAEGTA